MVKKLKPEDVVTKLKPCISKAHYDLKYVKSALVDWEDRYKVVELNPDFQRGHIWSEHQQTKFIEGMLKNTVSESSLTIHFNNPYYRGYEPKNTDLPNGFQCIDGLQRLTAILKYLNGELYPFGYDVNFFNTQYEYSGSYLYIYIAMYSYEKKKDLLEHYLAINEGKTVHTDEELNRVKGMINELH